MFYFYFYEYISLRMNFVPNGCICEWIDTHTRTIGQYRATAEPHRPLTPLRSPPLPPQVPAAERDRLRESLVNGTARVTADTLEFTQWYTVPFIEALDLVRGRRVFLQAGLAFIPARDLGSIVSAKFRAHLQHALAVSGRRGGGRIGNGDGGRGCGFCVAFRLLANATQSE